jgi:hypothetical protein
MLGMNHKSQSLLTYLEQNKPDLSRRTYLKVFKKPLQFVGIRLTHSLFSWSRLLFAEPGASNKSAGFSR